MVNCLLTEGQAPVYSCTMTTASVYLKCANLYDEAGELYGGVDEPIGYMVGSGADRDAGEKPLKVTEHVHHGFREQIWRKVDAGIHSIPDKDEAVSM